MLPTLSLGSLRSLAAQHAHAAWVPAGDLACPPRSPHPASLRIGIGDEGVLEGAVLHRALQVVVHAARLGPHIDP